MMGSLNSPGKKWKANTTDYVFDGCKAKKQAHFHDREDATIMIMMIIMVLM